MAENSHNLVLNKIENLIHKRQWLEAKSLAEKEISVYPMDFDLNMMLGVINASTEGFSDAIKYYSCAMKQTELVEAKVDIHSNLARCHELNYDYDSAIITYRSGLKLSPKQVEFLFGLAQNLTVIGCLEEALNSFYQVILNTNSNRMNGVVQEIRASAIFALSHGALPNDKKYSEILDFEYLEKEMTLMSNPENKAKLYFALATLSEHHQQYKEAFHYFEIGNQIKKTIAPYDHALALKEMENIKEFFSHERVIQQRSLTKNIEWLKKLTPIFIVGLPRSGSTLVESLLTSAKGVISAGEANFIPSIISNMPTKNQRYDTLPRKLKDVSIDQVEQLAASYIERHSKNAIVTVDKLPANFWNVGFIKLIFPNAKIIFCQKHPLDACFSLFKQNFHEGHPYANSLEDSANYFDLSQSLISHWQSVFPDSIYRLQYEDLVTSPTEECKSLFQYCGVEWHESYLEEYTNNKQVRTGSTFQVRERLNTKSINRWKNYEIYLDRLILRYGSEKH